MRWVQKITENKHRYTKLQVLMRIQKTYIVLTVVVTTVGTASSGKSNNSRRERTTEEVFKTNNK